MSELFRVVPGDLRAHGTTIGHVGHAIGAKTPDEHTLSVDAYGLIGRVFSATAMSAMGTGAVAVEKLRRALGEAANGLGDCAAGYEDADRQAAALFGGDR